MPSKIIINHSENYRERSGKIRYIIIHCSKFTPEKQIEILDEYRNHHIEPKRLRFVYERVGKEAILVLIEGQKNGKPGLKIETPFILYQEDGNMTPEYENFNREVKE